MLLNLPLSRIVRVAEYDVAIYLMLGLFIGPHSQAGKNTEHNNDFINPGGTFKTRRFISPVVTASKCSQTASNGQPGINLTDGSISGQNTSTKFRRLRSLSSLSIAFSTAFGF